MNDLIHYFVPKKILNLVNKYCYYRYRDLFFYNIKKLDFKLWMKKIICSRHQLSQYSSYCTHIDVDVLYPWDMRFLEHCQYIKVHSISFDVDRRYLQCRHLLLPKKQITADDNDFYTFSKLLLIFFRIFT